MKQPQAIRGTDVKVPRTVTCRLSNWRKSQSSTVHSEAVLSHAVTDRGINMEGDLATSKQVAYAVTLGPHSLIPGIRPEKTTRQIHM